MVRSVLLLVSLFSLQILFAQVQEDSIFVTSHNRVDMVWHESYDRTAYFPTEGKKFRKIIMYYTLSCASGGCSDWDYDVNTYIMHNTGVKDSTVASLDTITTNPLMVDTTWNVFDKIEPYELGRFITPYGTYMNFRNQAYRTAGFDSSWKHTFVYDVTDYAMLLKDSVTIRSKYNGWSSGFGATIQFVFIEGTPQREVLEIRNIYRNGGSYQNSSQFETNVIPPVTVPIPEGTEQAQAKVIITGHGANSGTGCGEFCDKDYYLHINGEKRFTSRMWRDDCGDVAVSPQGGTWIFSRGNWCPGDKVHERRHELTQYLTGDEITIDLEIEPYSLSGSGGASHSLSTTVFFYGKNNYDFDAELHTIIAPSTESEQLKWNPTCGDPIVVIRNNGHETLRYAKIEYGPVGGLQNSYEWSGELGYQQKDTIYLPPPRWNGIDPAQNRFRARIVTPNHRYFDAVTANDAYEVDVELVPRWEPFRLLFRTNGVPQENHLTITNEKGEVVFEMKPQDLSPNTTYSENLNLPFGCYQLLLTDEGDDGLDFWYYRNIGQNQRTGGYLRVFKQSSGIYENFGGDFGTEIRHDFIVGEMSIAEAPTTQPVEITVFPNPSGGMVNIVIPETDDEVLVSVIDQLGKTVITERNIPTDVSHWYPLSLEDLPRGVFTVRIKVGENYFSEKIVLTK